MNINDCSCTGVSVGPSYVALESEVPSSKAQNSRASVSDVIAPQPITVAAAIL